MHRRDLLASVGAGSVAGTAGCVGLLPKHCQPADRTLAELDDAVERGADPGEVTVRGVVRELDVTMTIDDGTGYAELSPPVLKEFNEDWFDRGDCVEAAGRVAAAFSREYGYLDVEVDSGEDVETVGVGTAKSDPEPMPRKPDASFDVDFENGGVVLTHAGTEPVPAAALQVRRLTNGRKALSTYRWHELAAVAPDATVSEGDGTTFRRSGQGHLVWRYDDHWARPISSGWEL